MLGAGSGEHSVSGRAEEKSNQIKFATHANAGLQGDHNAVRGDPKKDHQGTKQHKEA